VGPHPAVAAVRLAVRRCLAGLPPGDLVLAACSGGADSLALAAALAFEGPRLGLRAGSVTVDHALQPGSAAQASRVAATLAGLGLDPVRAVRVTVARPGGAAGAGPGAAAVPYRGPEAAARAARYAALDDAVAACEAAAILLGHTLDDQAETVLLGLARGSGARSLAGMAERSGRYLRPLLSVRRTQTAAACAALGLEPWDDPHNSDPAYARVRVRHRVLPVLEAELAATAGQELADGEPGLPADALAALDAAIRARVLRQAALAAGAPAGALAERHVSELDALVTDWRGQQWVDLPGAVRCQRRCGRLLFATVRHTDVARSEGRG
jgi:tRNA(Ile)-lysidine synthase